MLREFLERFKAAGQTRVPFIRPKTTAEDGESEEEDESSEEEDKAVMMPRRSKRPRLLSTDDGKCLNEFNV